MMMDTSHLKPVSFPADHATAMPAYVDQSHLVVSDLDAVSSWYQRILGLSPIDTSTNGVTLGVAGTPLLTLTGGGSAKKAPVSAPGLFHHAFLVPDRAGLGRWLVHASENGVQLQGASDHLVSEAIYLADPEGNGIEIYRDRPREEWNYSADGMVAVNTLPLDLQALYDETPKSGWNGLPPGTALGHIHLQVSDIPQAEAFFRDALGLDVMARYPGASFFATGKYHHHVAANIWNSRGAPKRQGNITGLADYTIRFRDPAVLAATIEKLDALELVVNRSGSAYSLIDPWGIGLNLEG